MLSDADDGRGTMATTKRTGRADVRLSSRVFAGAAAAACVRARQWRA
jgi:hypothetical protein